MRSCQCCIFYFKDEERMTGMSMKRSLQRFLQKRKTRSEVTKSPYFHPRTHTSSPLRDPPHVCNFFFMIIFWWFFFFFEL
ncbi:hypothetical protein QJS10_CPA01g00517 [Acorus calamus]|uniref:Uncharacterized protein n=1 Tax=Acorus calamus TaxID=4465 RepID=A0AAV9FIN4_ACOCL|nr:hypothetical protein QJS10_CPA01g00517 [Acorus calamus]